MTIISGGTESKGLEGLMDSAGGGREMERFLRLACRFARGNGEAGGVERPSLEISSDSFFSGTAGSSFASSAISTTGIVSHTFERSGKAGRLRGNPKLSNSEIRKEKTSDLRLATKEGGESSTILMYALDYIISNQWAAL